eukprot:scaffold12648_cov79-Skeletonema_menzelii.AAC.1
MTFLFLFYLQFDLRCSELADYLPKTAVYNSSFHLSTASLAPLIWSLTIILLKEARLLEMEMRITA